MNGPAQAPKNLTNPRSLSRSATLVFGNLACLLACCLALVACSKKPVETTDPKPAANNAGVSIANQVDGAAPPPPAPVAATGGAPEQSAAATPGAPPPANINEATSATQADFSAGNDLKGGELATPQVLAAYNKRLARVNFQISDFPQDIEQLKKWPMMPPLPKAPPGHKLVYDVKTRMLLVE